MRLFIFGSRSITTPDIARHIPPGITVVIHGGAAGVDTAAGEYAAANGIPTEVYAPDYARYGRAATHVRNDLMIKNCDAALCFWDGKSKGTSSVIKKIQKKGINLTVVTI